jgi:hypothetical protein
VKRLADASTDEGIARYRRALLFYADNLDEIKAWSPKL